jgi:tubulin---tyrosine ligase
MHILVVNDDGPPDAQWSPYIHSLVSELQAAGHLVSVVIPNCQRSWISKAHIVGQTLTPRYYDPGTVFGDDSTYSEHPFHDGREQWVILDGTPASCVQIGLYHAFQHRGAVDLVLGGPNYGRNTTSFFALASGTLGAAMEGAINGKRSIALSYAFFSEEEDRTAIAEATKMSVRLITKLYKSWAEDVQVYNINMPVERRVSKAKIVFTSIMPTATRQSSFQAVETGVEEIATTSNVDEHMIRMSEELGQVMQRQPTPKPAPRYKWAPCFDSINEDIGRADSGTDGVEVLRRNIRFGRSHSSLPLHH